MCGSFVVIEVQELLYSYQLGRKLTKSRMSLMAEGGKEHVEGGERTEVAKLGK